MHTALDAAEIGLFTLSLRYKPGAFTFGENLCGFPPVYRFYAEALASGVYRRLLCCPKGTADHNALRAAAQMAGAP